MSRRCSRTVALLALLGVLAAAPAWAAVFMPTGSLDLGRAGDDPKAAGSWTYDAGTSTHTVQGSGSDWWDGGEYAHFAYAPVTGDFWIESSVEWVNRTGDWNAMDYWIKAGLAIRNDINVGAGNEKEVNYFNAYLRPDRNEAAFQGRTVASSGMFNYQTGGMPAQPAKVALNRWTAPEGDVLVQGLVNKGSGWEVVASQWAPNLANSAYVGLAVTAHNNDGRLESAKFANVEILPAVTPTGTLPRRAGEAINDPEHVEPVRGGWGVVEVIGNGNMGSVADAVTSLQSTSGTRVKYQLMGAINIADHEGNVKNFGGDRGYQVVYAGKATGGSVDDIALLARGRVMIPETGDWTFYMNADDGSELSIDNRALVIGGENWNENYFGTVHLTAGPHNIQVIHREDGGGADVEVAAAKGATTDLRSFNLIGSNAAARPAHSVWVPGYQGLQVGATVPSSDGPDNRDQAYAALQAAIADGSIRIATPDRVNHGDPQASGGKFGDKLDFPNNTAADDDNFAFGAMGKLVIPATGTYFLGYQSDDGAALQIVGQTWKAVVENVTGAGTIEGDWLKTDAWTGDSWTVGEIDLAAGTYDFNFVSYEGGGGSYATMFGSSEKGNYYLMAGGSQEIKVPYAAAALNLVPEPSTWAMLLVSAGLGLIGWRRHRKP